jgi:glycerol-3-phosphate O-acyltransferase
MIQSPGRLVEWLGRVLFRHVKFDDADLATIRDVNQRGTPIYVLYVRSLLDYMYFCYAFVRFGLPLVGFAEGMDLRYVLPREAISWFWRRLFGRRQQLSDGEALQALIAADRPCLVSLKRPRTLIQWGADSQGTLLADVIASQALTGRPVILVPLQVVWHHVPETYRRSIADVLLGDPQAPGRLRKLLSFLWNRRRANVGVGHPLELPAFLATNRDADVTAVVARLKFALNNEFLLESKAIRGPVLKGAQRLIDEILRTPPFIEEVERHAAREGFAPAAEMKRARSMLKKMAADFSFNWLEGFALTLGLIFNRLFTDVTVDTAGLQGIREAARTGPIVLAPAHRSHLDYLVYSLVFYTHGLIPPHIAAGENLSFWPMGPIFRRSGAFFIRRTMRGAELYAMALRHYVRKLLKDGYWIEFFIEGTRSRSGKSVPPKYGMLMMVVDAVASGAAPDAHLVPAAVTYERVIEMASYQRESEGREKAPESVATLARSAKVLGTRYGRMYVQFGRPIGIKEFLQASGVSIPLPAGESVPRHVLRHLAHAVAWRNDRAMRVTPQHLVSFALLTHRRRGLERERLLERVGFLVAYLTARGALLSDPLADPLREKGLLRDCNNTSIGPDDKAERESNDLLGAALARPIDEVVRLFVRDKLVRLGSFGDDWVVSPEEAGRTVLDYHKNAILHNFVDDALFATAVLRLLEKGPVAETDLMAECRLLSRAMKLEFVYGAEGFEVTYAATLERIVHEGLLRREAGGLDADADAREALGFFAASVQPFVESYRILAKAAQAPGAPVAEKELVKAALRTGRRLYSVGEVELPESVNAVTFANAAEWLRGQVASGASPTRADAARDLLRAVEGRSAAASLVPDTQSVS